MSIKKGYKHTELGWLPEDWAVNSIGRLTDKIKNPVDVKRDFLYQEIGVRSHGKGLFHKEPILGKKLGNKSVFWVEPDCVVLNIVFAWEQAIAKTTENEKGFIASHRFPMFKPKKGVLNIDYVLNFFKTPKGKSLLQLASPGGAGRNKTLGQEYFINTIIPVPPFIEQNKIATILNTAERVAEQMTLLIEEKERLRKSLMQQLLTGKKRLKGFKGKWKKIPLGEVLQYEQPSKYIVKSTNYSDKFKTAVLTANKSFILGYTNESIGVYKNIPAIIFDDFTTMSKYVDFPFKVKSSALKILKLRNSSFNLKFVFDHLQQIKNPIGDHKRYWISEYQEMEIFAPPIDEQNAIARISASLDNEIVRLRAQLDLYQQKIKGLKQKLFTGNVRVKVNKK